MPAFVLTEDNLARTKREIRRKFPNAKSAHLSEALAASLGMRTYAALLEDIRKVDPDYPPILAINEDAFLTRLKTLCQSEFPEMPEEGFFGKFSFRGYLPLIRTRYKRQHEIAYNTQRGKAWRNLVVAATNAGIEQRLFSVRKGDNRWPKADQGRGFTYHFDLHGRAGMAYVNDIGFGELKIHAALNPPHDADLCIFLPAAGFLAGNAFGIACMDRSQGAYLQTTPAFFRIKKPLLPFLANIDIRTKGYGDKGKVVM